MTYLTRLMLNPASRMVQSEAGRPYQLHRTIQSAFDTKREDGNILYRLDVNQRALPVLLIQSAAAPNLDEWVGKDGGRYLSQPPDSKAIKLAVQTGIAYRFRLRANPSKKVRREGQKHSARVGYYKEDDQLAWLSRQATQCGFRLLHANVGPSQKMSDRTKKITIYTVQFDGILVVDNRDLFTTTLHNGVGPSKAFGCGLLSLARA